MPKLLKWMALSVLVLVILGYLGVLGVFYVRQREMQYFPDGPVTALSTSRLTGAETVTIPTSDNQVVNGWYQPPSPGKPVILFYKGNLGSFGDERERYEAWTDSGYGFLAFDYRGFPASPGTITQQHILDDATAAYDWVAAKGFPIVIWGRSMGSAPATYIAGRHPTDALMLETPFLSAVDVALDRYPYIPVQWLMLDTFPEKTWILDVKAPTFVAHGTNDHTIDVHHGKAIYALAPNKYGLWIVEGADHSDLWKAGIWARAEAFFADVESRARGASAAN